VNGQIRWGVVGPGRIAEKVMATLTTSLRQALPGQARVFGTAGWIDVLPRFHHPQTIVLHRAGAEAITRPQAGGGYAHELTEVTECLRAGRSESAVMPLADTLAVASVLGQAADQLGVRHTEDATAVQERHRSGHPSG
jgi:predicted dehydrogenase